jgi:predicted negative regulator of RcsB-dependent stress response
VAEERTDEEQIEALKTWWNENGFKTGLAIILLIAGYFGWQTWEGKMASESENASKLWQETMDIFSTEDSGRILGLDQRLAINGKADQLKSEFSGTAYAHFAAALKAKLAVEKGDLDLAATELQWSIDNGAERATEIIMRLRLARVESARGNPKLALEMIQSADTGAHKSAYEEAKGDFYVQLGDSESAFTAYEAAVLSNESTSPAARNILELKLSQVRPVDNRAEFGIENEPSSDGPMRENNK